MEIYVSLFGKKKEVIGWNELLEQEKIPFRYRGENFRIFSPVNILVGKIPKKIFKNPGKIFVLEPNLISRKDPLLSSSRIIQQKKNILKISTHISSRVIFCSVDRNKTLNFLGDVLIKAFNIANLPYIHIWYYPEPCQSVFLFRQDVDYVDQKGLENLLWITKKFHVKGTYFVNISGEEEFDEKIGPLNLQQPTTPSRRRILHKILLEGNEIGNHGYWHWVFKDFKNNDQNIKRCSRYLRKLFHVKDRGFAAPGAEWNFNLAKAIEKNGYIYACNGLSDGGFPYYPLCGERRIKVLEIPCFFLCDASQYRFLSDAEINFSHQWIKKLKNSYLGLISQQIKNNEPIAILGHPNLVGRVAKSFFYSIFKKLKTLKIPSYTFYEFANWWRQREKMKLSYRKTKRGFLVDVTHPKIILESIYRGDKKLIKIKNKNEEIKYL